VQRLAPKGGQALTFTQLPRTTRRSAGLTPGQIRLRDNTGETVYFASAKPDLDLVIYGVVPPNADVQVDAGFDVDENRARGYLTGTAYSAWCDYGESGDTHVSQVITISRETFDLARALDWPTYSMLREPENVDLGRRLAAHEREVLGAL
jgi:hypothetical protein